MMRGLPVLATVLLAACATTPPVPHFGEPLIIAHRGASAERPEHTLEAYRRAIEQGADYIEPDLVMTRDGVFVARHENEISGTTDVADRPEFADRRTTKTIDGRQVTGWFTEDFTLAELRSLRARERLPDLRPASAAYDGRFAIPTLAEIIALAQAADRPVGLAPEIKHPGYFRAIGLPMEEALAEQLAAAGYDGAADPVIIQSFEIAPLRRLDGLTGLRLLQLIGGSGGPADDPSQRYADMVTREGLRRIARYADAIGPDKAWLGLDADAAARDLPPRLADAAHRAGLEIILYTFRPENTFLPPDLRAGDDPRAHGDLRRHIARALQHDIDGLFTDHVPPAIEARAEHRIILTGDGGGELPSAAVTAPAILSPRP